ncbi:MAG TPA: hypothetical protein VIV55_10275 [Flavobacterium sp.]
MKNYIFTIQGSICCKQILFTNIEDKNDVITYLKNEYNDYKIIFSEEVTTFSKVIDAKDLKKSPPINFYDFDFHKSGLTKEKVLSEIKKLSKARLYTWVKLNDRNGEWEGFIPKDYLVEVMYNAITN